MKKQILAMGGGGFSMEPENLKLDKYLLSLSEKPKPKVCFIGTASGDAESYIERFYESLNTLNCETSHLSLYKAPIGDLREYVMDKDIFYVGGGNTRNLITLWKEWKLDQYLRDAYEAGKIMAGISAGSICWFDEGVTDSVPGKLSSLKCLGFLKGSNCPHYDGEAERRPSFHSLMKEGLISNGIAADDGVALHYINEKLENIVTSRPDKRAYSLRLESEEVIEDELSAKYLGGNTLLVRRAAQCDAEAIHKAHMRSIQEVCSKEHSEEEILAWGHRDYKEEQRLDAINNDLVWVVEDNGNIEGYGHFRIFEKEGVKRGHIFGLYLTSKVLGKSFGKAIMNMMLEEAQNEGVQRITLESTISAHDFYKKMGFSDSGPLKTVQISQTPIRCYPMVMEL